MFFLGTEVSIVAGVISTCQAKEQAVAITLIQRYLPQYVISFEHLKCF